MDSEKKKEQQRVDYVIGRIKEKIETTENELEKAHKETSSVEKNYVQNARINTFEVDDRMETNAEVQQQKQLVAKNVENERILKQELSKLTLLKDSPYFGRIDILDQGEEEPESLYIGTASFAENNILNVHEISLPAGLFICLLPLPTGNIARISPKSRSLPNR